MAGGSRKAHTKSRNGCGQCKKRRRKCDQRPPRCSNCERWGIDCDFTALSAAVEQVASRAFLSGATIDSQFLTFPLPSPLFDARDIDLLQHYSIRTAFILSGSDERSIWQTHVPQEAKSHPYVMHGLLAISALHMSFIHPQDQHQCIWLALKHHEQGLASFRSSVHTITPENATAVLSFEFFANLVSSGLPVLSNLSGIQNAIASFVQTLILSRHAWAVLQPVIPSLSQSHFGPLIDLKAHFPTKDAAKQTLLRHTDGMFDRLYHFNETALHSGELKTAYKDAIDILAVIFEGLRNRPPRWADCLFWNTRVSKEYFSLLQQMQPFALVVLAHWLVVLYYSPTFWYKLWARKMIEEVCQSVGEELKPAMAWPAEAVGVIPRAVHDVQCNCTGCQGHAVLENWQKDLASEMML
ncbi:hypothetical protein CC78DRAFT_569978 [Lojkania enalia]|uniref:Zn(2)-C6 fungal-type domain-containing protein n=1 Tax=Lojkania enalia TaxID=147567 RepID=A0A9P4K9Y8_9PLEO|nr:hypothetical protein CC78DRAFT_569978 [Didymosphaeria enalia]